MARQASIPLNTYAAGAYGPYTIDGGQLGDVGARITIQRGASGTWPLTASSPVMSVLIEFLYQHGWGPGAIATFTGGTQTAKHGGTKTHEHLLVYWAKELVNGVLTPIRPASVRVTVNLLVSLEASAQLEWL